MYEQSQIFIQNFYPNFRFKIHFKGFVFLYSLFLWYIQMLQLNSLIDAFFYFPYGMHAAYPVIFPK